MVLFLIIQQTCKLKFCSSVPVIIFYFNRRSFSSLYGTRRPIAQIVNLPRDACTSQSNPKTPSNKRRVTRVSERDTHRGDETVKRVSQRKVISHGISLKKRKVDVKSELRIQNGSWRFIKSRNVKRHQRYKEKKNTGQLLSKHIHSNLNRG